MDITRPTPERPLPTGAAAVGVSLLLVLRGPVGPDPCSTLYRGGWDHKEMSPVSSALLCIHSDSSMGLLFTDAQGDQISPSNIGGLALYFPSLSSPWPSGTWALRG